MNETDTNNSPAETGQMDGFGILNLSPEVATRTYGVLATTLGIFVPLFFNMMMRGHDTWGKIGWKFSAYAHLVTWCPVSLVWLITLGLKSSTALYFWSGFTRFSVFGPFLLYPMSIFYMFKFAKNDNDIQGYGAVGGILFTLYTAASMYFQIAFLPAIDEGYF